MVTITNKTPDVLTKMGKSITDVAYNINDEEAENDDDDDDDDDDDEDAPDAPGGDEALARKLAKERNGVRSSSRLARDVDTLQDAKEGVAEREKKQIKLMTRRNEMRLRELARANRAKGDGDDRDAVEELEAYKRTRDYPDNVQPNQVKVDMASQCVILPICGNPIPFHISTIKNVVLPDADGATLLRINFYTAGMAVGKDAPANMVKLVAKYAPYASFVREMTFRSLDGHNLTLAFRQISELRRRVRQKELREQEEADLVVQEKLVRTRNEKVPRLADLTMRPAFANRKTQGNLEAHTNGLRFISTRQEVVDVMYDNIKYAIFQPCESEIMVLIHFHLKNPIMIGKKKQRDVQFFTEVIDASQAVDNSRRSMYDPDEMDDEHREKQLRKRLNQAFKDFCKKVDAVGKKNGHQLEFDIPYRDLGFTGNPNKEMVTITPTLNCLVNLTESPFFVVDLEEVDHVHFERVTYMSKAFDMVLVNKDFSKKPWQISMIPHGDKDAIQEWLTDMELTYTEGPVNLNWKQIVSTIKEDDRFYMNTEDDEVTEKEAGWEFLRMYGHEDDEQEDDEEEDSVYESEKAEEEESEEESAEEDFDSEDDDEDNFDGDEELEEEGMDWDDLEAVAAASDRRRVNDVDEVTPTKAKKRNGGGGGGGGGKKQRR
jgi:nucleosome binding factor SPN SPT16 subunit